MDVASLEHLFGRCILMAVSCLGNCVILYKQKIRAENSGAVAIDRTWS